MPGLTAPALNGNFPHLARLESESIRMRHEAVVEARNPAMRFSAGKDSTLLAHLARRTFRGQRQRGSDDGGDGGSFENKQCEGCC